jgi:hypothetical protein
VSHAIARRRGNLETIERDSPATIVRDIEGVVDARPATVVENDGKEVVLRDEVTGLVEHAWARTGSVLLGVRLDEVRLDALRLARACAPCGAVDVPGVTTAPLLALAPATSFAPHTIPHAVCGRCLPSLPDELLVRALHPARSLLRGVLLEDAARPPKDAREQRRSERAHTTLARLEGAAVTEGWRIDDRALLDAPVPLRDDAIAWLIAGDAAPRHAAGPGPLRRADVEWAGRRVPEVRFVRDDASARIEPFGTVIARRHG